MTRSKLWLHSIVPAQALPLVRAAAAQGTPFAGVKNVDHPGLAVEVKVASPQTKTITRFVQAELDGAQDVQRWTPASMRAAAWALLQHVFDHTNPDERRATDWFEVMNEADPPGADGWAAFGRYQIAVIDEAERRGVKVALPGCNAGTPEWDEMAAWVATGVFARLRNGGHLLTLHEGVVWDDRPVDFGMGDRLPGAPVVAGAGSLSARFRYLYQLLRERGEAVPCVISEWYGGGGFGQTPGAQVERMAWYDRLVSRDPYILGFAPFTLDPNDGWRISDYTSAFTQAVLPYLAALAGEPAWPEVLIADWSMYQSRFTGDPNSWADKYNPARWIVDVDWAALERAAPIAAIGLRIGIGVTQDPCFERYLAGVLASPRLRDHWFVYHVFVPDYPPNIQADLVRRWCGARRPPLGVYEDLENYAETFAQVNSCLLATDELFDRVTGIYSGGPYMDSHFSLLEQLAWRHRPGWWAGYPRYIPPAAWVGRVPDHVLHQFTAAYVLPGLRRRCDMSRLNPYWRLDDLRAGLPVEDSAMSLFLSIDHLAPELQAKLEAHMQALYADLEARGDLYPYPPAPPPPEPPRPWYATWVPIYTLKPTGKVIPFYNADGTRRTVTPTSRALNPNSQGKGWDVFEVNVPRRLLRVTSLPLERQPDWWVLADDVEPDGAG